MLRSTRVLVVPSLDDFVVLPDAASVILGARDDRVTLVIEGAGENFVLMAVAFRSQALDLVACVS